MNYAKRLGALILALLMVVGAMPALVMAEEEVFDDLSIHGTFAVEMGGTVYAALVVGGDQRGLFAIPEDGSEITQLDTGSDISDLVHVGDYIYYLRTQGSDQHVMRVDGAGNVTVMAEFEADVQASNLAWYDDVLYCIANERMYIVSPDGSGDSQLLCDELVDDYVIINGVIYYSAAGDPYTYEKAVSTQEETVKQTGGSLW